MYGGKSDVQTEPVAQAVCGTRGHRWGQGVQASTGPVLWAMGQTGAFSATGLAKLAFHVNHTGIHERI